MQLEKVESTMTKGYQDFERYQVLNLIEINIEDDGIINLLKKHKNSILCFVLVGLLFSSRIKNKKNQIFIVSNELANGHDSLINGKPHKILCVINLSEIHPWEKIKGVSNWINITFEHSDRRYKADHFTFSFKSQNLQDTLNFQFTLLGSDMKKT